MQDLSKSEISLEESKCLLVEMLKCIDGVCRENNLRYSLDYGTLLGAVRHKGFIPWDDDIDLSMPRIDFEKFKSVFANSRYEMLSEDDEKWGRHFVRICDTYTRIEFNNLKEDVPQHGLWIAIIPIDNVPDNCDEWKRMQHDIDFWEGLRRLKHSKWTDGFIRNLAKRFLKIILSPIPVKLINRRTKKCMTRYNNIETNCCYQRGRLYHVHPSSNYEKYIDLEFEGYQFMCIAAYDEYLCHEYGDYMQLPPEKERVPKHDYTAYWK